MNYFNNFIIIDDEKINNQICRKLIEKAFPDANIIDFTLPVEGFAYILEQYAIMGRAVLLLDINMPEMNAWDFLEKFEKLDETLKARVKIYILSSSVDKNDMQRANANKNVEYYLIKPLTMESIRLIIHVLNKRFGQQAK